MPHTLLLADDSVTIQRVIELTFADEDVRVVAVSNGDEAIAFVERTPPDIVLADVGMPGRNGYEVAQHIKQNPRLAHIPVLLLTGAFEPVDQAQVTAVGSDGVLAKPFEPQLVIGRVRELLARGAQPSGAAAAPPPAPPAPPAPAWGSSFGDQLSASAPTAPAGATGTNDYFDRLDQAFANLGAGKPTESKAPDAAAGGDMDWFEPKRGRTDAPIAPDMWNAPSTASVPDLPLSHGSPQSDFDRLGELGIQPDGAAASSPPTGPVPPPSPVAHSSVAPAALPPLADAFAALLAAERSGQAPSSAPSWPAGPAADAVNEDLVERVARRVLDQLSDRVVRETVAEIVTDVAERLVRQEIERIKASIK